jgi:hypothetical protein
VSGQLLNLDWNRCTPAVLNNISSNTLLLHSSCSGKGDSACLFILQMMIAVSLNLPPPSGGIGGGGGGGGEGGISSDVLAS